MANGYARIIGPDRTVEMDTETCGHCNGVVHVSASHTVEGLIDVSTRPDDVTAKCFVCMKRICKACEKRRQRTKRCVTYEKRMAAMESVVRRTEARDSFLKTVIG